MIWRIPVLLLLLVTSACGVDTDVASIRFVAQLNGQPVKCTATGDATTLSDLRFYVSEIRVIRPDGTFAPARLLDNGRWQGSEIALLDFEDGSGACANGTADMNSEILMEVESGDIAALQFTVGVPFALNHADPLQASAPLNDSSMHWHWRSGYKFVRAGLASAADSVYVHLGSAGCNGTVGHITGCDSPNRFTVTLQDWQPGRRIMVDLGPLERATNLDDGVLDSCSSGPAEESCARFLPIFGIANRPSTVLDRQQLFRLEPQ